MFFFVNFITNVCNHNVTTKRGKEVGIKLFTKNFIFPVVFYMTTLLHEWAVTDARSNLTSNIYTKILNGQPYFEYISL